MRGKTITCENAGCSVEFVKKTHNQRYHDDECCRLATNKNMTFKYHAQQAQRLGIARYCDDCESKLSRYNPASKCNSCSQKNETSRNNAVSLMLSNIAWA